MAASVLAAAGPGTAAPRYVFPDLAADQRLLPELDTRFLSARLGGEFIADWTGFAQDAASLAQVGRQADRLEIRSARVQFVGGLIDTYRLTYKIGGQYQGFDVNPQRNWDMTDLSLTWLLDKGGSRITAGRIKESFSYEVIGSTASMAQSERTLSPFASARSNGAMLTAVFGPDRRWTASLGLYGEGGLALSARLTHLVIDDPGHRRFLHLGAAFRHLPASAGDLRYRGRPASNVADTFVDTGSFAADSADHYGLEALWSDGGLSVLGELVVADVSAADAGNPTFDGLSLTASWVLTGETRPYDRLVGQAGRIVPEGRWGAPELVARYAAIDLDGGRLRGGRYDRLDLGINWWATTRWKLGAVVGRTWLYRDGRRGITDSLLLRGQWVY